MEFQLFFPPFLDNFSHFEGPENTFPTNGVFQCPENTPSEAIFPLFFPSLRSISAFLHFVLLKRLQKLFDGLPPPF